MTTMKLTAWLACAVVLAAAVRNADGSTVDCAGGGKFADEACFNVFSHCQDFTIFKDEYQIEEFSADLKMDSSGDGYPTHYNFDETAQRGTRGRIHWEKGNTNVTVAVKLTKDNTVLPEGTTVVAHIHSKRCEDNMGGPHYKYNSTGPDAGDNIFSFNLTFDGKDRFQQTSTKREYLADYDRATSIVLHEPEATSNGFSPVSSSKGAKFACCNLQPKLPDLPDQWSATIEANFIGDGKSYSMLRKEWYDKAKGKVRVDVHSAWAKLVHLVDVDGSEMKTLHKNETFPSGHCTQTTNLGRRASGLRNDTTGHMRSTADWISFGAGNTPVIYEGVTNPDEHVRGVPCEKWSRLISFGRQGFHANYTFEYFFPVTSWRIRRESYHRLLARMVIKSNSGFRHKPVLHYYDFVDMVPYIVDDYIFDACNIFLPSGSLEGNCSCGKPGGSMTDSSNYGEPVWKVAVVGIGCSLGGALLAAIATYVYFTKFGGLENRANQHMKFSENPMGQL